MAFPKRLCLTAVLAALTFLLLPTFGSWVPPAANVPFSVDVVNEQALSAVLLSATHVDRLMSVLDRPFERLFGNFADGAYGPMAVAGQSLFSPVTFSVPIDRAQGRSSSTSGTARRQAQAQSGYAELSDLEHRSKTLADEAMALHDALEKAEKSADLLPYLTSLIDLRAQVARSIGPVAPAEATSESGYSRMLGRQIDRQSKRFQEAVSKKNEQALDKLNLETRALVIARIDSQLASAERELRRRHRPIALASLFGAAKSLGRLRREANWQRGRLYRRTTFASTLRLKGTEKMEGFLEPGAWLDEGYVRPEHRQTLFDRAKRIWGKRRGPTSYESIPKFLRSQDRVIKKSFDAAFELSEYMAYMRYVQLLVEFRPGLQELKKAQRDARLVRRWAARGTGAIRQAVAKALSRLDGAFMTAIHLRGQSPEQKTFDDVHLLLQSSIESAREVLAKRLEEIKSRRQATLDRVLEFVAPHLEPKTPPAPSGSPELAHAA